MFCKPPPSYPDTYLLLSPSSPWVKNVCMRVCVHPKSPVTEGSCWFKQEHFVGSERGERQMGCLAGLKKGARREKNNTV